MEFDVIVLTGGSASRLNGADKAGLRIGDRTLLELTLDAVSGARRVVVVGPHGDVVEQPPGGGPAAGVAAAVTALAADPDASDAVLVLACDMPLVAGVVPVLLAAGPGVLARDGDRTQYLAGLHHTVALRGAVGERPERLHGASMRSLLAGLDLREVQVPAGSTADVDTWADAEQAGVDQAGGVR